MTALAVADRDVDTVYAPRACSPLTKVQKYRIPNRVRQPATEQFIHMTALGRTLNMQQPDGASSTAYIYRGNQTTGRPDRKVEAVHHGRSE